ncbi:MAG: hypothetical protein ACRENO_03725 [Thermodesulfobacteriota bacterium]
MYSRCIVLFLLISGLLIFPVQKDLFAEESELEILKKQVQQMQDNMKVMLDKIDELEKKNSEFEKRAGEQPLLEAPETTVEVEIKPESERRVAILLSPKQRGTTFLDNAFQTFNPSISVLAVFAAAYFSDNDPIVLAENDPEQTGINLQEIEVAFQSVVDPYFRFDSFFSFSTEGVELEEAYGTTLLNLPLNAQIRAGRMRAKFGRINLFHRHTQDFVTLPIVAAEFLGEHLNPTSVEANFLLPLPWFSELSASIGSPDVETASFDRDSDSNNISRLLYIFHLGNFFEISDALGLSLGSSFATGSNGTGPGNRTNLFGIDLYTKYRPLKDNPYQSVTFQSELMFRDAETEDGDIFDYGFYAQAVYKFHKRWSAGLRFGYADTDDPLTFEAEEDEERFILPSGISQTAREGEEEEGVLGLFGKQYRISGMLTFTPSEFSVIRLQYDYIDQQFDSSESAVFLQFQYSIGAHGTHPF